MEIVTLKLTDIKPYERNARKNDQAVDAVAESIRQCEYIAPIIVDENHVILAGHTRWKALKKLGRAEAECVVKTGLIDEQKRKYRLLDNKTAELADWDFDLLTDELEGLDFGELDLDWGIESKDGKELIEDNYKIEPPENPRSKPGDVWALGEHRLMCGSSTDAGDVSRLMEGKKAILLFTSPPYSDLRDYNGGKNLTPGHLSEFIYTYKDYANIQAVNLGLKSKDDEIVQYWDEYIDAAHKSGLKLLAWNVWDKMMCGSVWMQKRFIPIRHEWIFVFGEKKIEMRETWGKKDGSIYKNGSTRTVRQKDGSTRVSTRGVANKYYKRMESVLDIPEQESLESVTKKFPEVGKIRAKHPATFPVSLPAEYIVAFSDEGDCVVEPFSGSGTTIIACEQLNRRCLAMELDPRYVDVAIDRWEQFTGREAVKLM